MVNLRCVAYCRVSTSEVEQKNSLNNQIEYYTELFKTKGYTPAKIGIYYDSKGNITKLDSGVFADEGITGTKKKNRKAFQYLLLCAENKEFDIIYCKNIQRFARNVEEGAGTLKRLKQLGIRVIFEEGNLDSSNSSHEFIINQLLGLAQQESQSKSEAVKWGIRKAQKEGKWTSNTPYGYDRVNGFLQRNTSEVDIVKQIYNLYVDERYGINKIVRLLRNNNVPTKQGKEWYFQHIRNILSNPLYKGIQTTHKTENMDVNVELKKKVPDHEQIVKSNENLRIVEDSIWALAQNIFKEQTELHTKKPKGTYQTGTHLFSSICYCGNCHSAMRRKRKRTKVKQKMVYLDKYEYVCSNNDLYKSCKWRNAIDEDILLEFAKDRITLHRNDKNILRYLFYEGYLKINYPKDDFELKVTNISTQIEELKKDFEHEKRQNKLGVVTDDELQEYNRNYRIILTELENEKLKFSNISKQIEEEKIKFEEFLKYLDNIDLENLKNSDLRKVFSKIIVFSDYKFENFEGERHKIVGDALQKYVDEPYTFRQKDYIKKITCNYMFMNVEEWDLFDYISKVEMEKIYERELSWYDGGSDINSDAWTEKFYDAKMQETNKEHDSKEDEDLPI